MAGEAKIAASADMVPRHYRVHLQASLDPMAMLELVQVVEALDVDDDVAGGFFARLRETVSEAYTGDRPQPIAAPDALPVDVDDDDASGSGGIAVE